MSLLHEMHWNPVLCQFVRINSFDIHTADSQTGAVLFDVSLMLILGTSSAQDALRCILV